MAFFRNSAVNLLNLHYGLHCITLYGGGAFFLVYLLKAGLSVPGVLVSLALILVGRFAVRPLVIPLAARWGLRAMLIAGTLLSALQYPVVAEVHGIGIALLALIIVAAVGDMLYWTAYHAYFAALGDNEFRGHQIGAREAIAAVVGIISPVFAGWMLVAFGPRAAFGATSIITALSQPCRFSARPRFAWRGTFPAYSRLRFRDRWCSWPTAGPRSGSCSPGD
jgi:DHA1 family inner membrane transport protein